MEKKKPRRVPTEYQCIYRQTDKDLYDVRYNYKELNEDTGKNEYKTKWVYGVKSIELAKKTLLQLQTSTYDDGEITLQEAYELWLAKARIEGYTDVAVKNTGEHIRMIYTVLSPDLKLRDVDFSLYSSFIERCRVESGYSEYTLSNLNKTFRKLITLAYKEERLKENPIYSFDKIEGFVRDRKVIVSPEEFRMMDNHLSETVFIRNGIDRNLKRRLCLNFLYYTGMTMNEILSVRYRDVTTRQEAPECPQTAFKGLWVHVQGATATKFIIGLDGAKKSKVRDVPLADQLSVLFLEDRKQHLSNGGSADDLVFEFTHGNIADMLRHLTKELHIEKKIVCQSFRDTFIEKMIKNGVALTQLCSVLGESYRTILTRYPHLFINDPQNIVRVFAEE